MTKRGIHIPSRQYAELLSEAWALSPMETGGLLLGRADDDLMVVTHVVGPGPQALHQRHRFEPDTDWQANGVARIWAAHPGTEYLGDWHTHPGGKPRPSTLDRETLEEIAAYPAARQSRPAMLILAFGRNGRVTPGAVRLGKRARVHDLPVNIVEDT